MLPSLSTAISGLQHSQERMNVIGNNVANINTVGFKAGRANFADAFSQTLNVASSAAGGQIGSGVTTSAIQNRYTQGALTQTGVPSDLAVAGNGFFLVRDTVSSAQFATRAGDFRLDASGYLVTNGGQRVQGNADAGLSTLGDLRIDTTGMPATSDPAAQMLSYAIDGEGKIKVSLSDGTQFVRGRVLLQNFSDPQALMKEGDNLYSGLAAAGPLGGAAAPTPAAPGTSGLGRLQAGALELSNVDLSNEFADLITTQRAFQASARLITTSDEIMQELVNLKR